MDTQTMTHDRLLALDNASFFWHLAKDRFYKAVEALDNGDWITHDLLMAQSDWLLARAKREEANA